MDYKKEYKSPLGRICLTSNGDYLTGLWFENSKDNLKHNKEYQKKDLKIFDETIKWLDIYFSGKDPDFTPKYKIDNTQPFSLLVLDIVSKIPYGKTISYNDIALEIAKIKNIKKMSAQAVGNAVGRNPICLIVPCHRVIGSKGNLTGYGGGIKNKLKLLELEKNDISKFKYPKKLKRCKWCNLNNPKYIKYHDSEWGKLNLDDNYLLEMLILESFQAGLSFECILNKREYFRKCYDNFNIDKIINYDDKKITELMNNKNIIRNKLKITASINNAKIFKNIVNEYGSFYNYLKQFTNDLIIYENHLTTSTLSDTISHDLQKRGMKFVGSIIIYSYLQAIGIINSHDLECFMHEKRIS